MTVTDEYRQLTRNILRQWRQATFCEIEAGLQWYDLAFAHAERLGAWHGCSVQQAAVVIAHLSPRVRWASNLELAQMLLEGREKPHWALTRQWDLAKGSLTASDPLASFSTRAFKTAMFARAILGNHDAVVVDGWTARAAGYPERQIRTKTGYHMVSEAFVRASRVSKISPRDTQAVVWCHVRGESA